MKIHELLSTPDKWTQNTSARDQNGISMSPVNPSATCWCLAGAMIKCYPRLEDELVVREMILQALKPNKYIFNWNDDHSRKWEDVYDLCKSLDI